MTTASDVLAARVAATGTVAAGRQRLKGYCVAPGGTAGSIVFRDGGAGGTTRVSIDITTNTATFQSLIPGDGVLFKTDIHVTLPAAAVITAFYG